MDSDNSNLVTGQVFVRHVSKGPTTPDGRTLVMLVGIVAVPPEALEYLKTEHQYAVLGRLMNRVVTGETLSLDVISSPVYEIDRSEISHGCGIDDLLREPIWRY